MSNQYCIGVPHSNEIRGISIDYNGHGTAVNDVAVVGLVMLALVLIIASIAWACRR